MVAQDEHQLGDFIKGRFLFIEDYCRKKGIDHQKALEDIRAEALRLAGSQDRRDILTRRLFGGLILSTSYLPDWVDQVFLEATTKVLKGPGAPLNTTTSRQPCVAFEAGRFNARRQADTIFKLLYERKKPQEWIKTTFPVLYRKCYGDKAADAMKVEELGPGHFRLTMDNQGLAKSGRLDCSTTIGFLFGSLEKLGAEEPLVTHDQCGAASAVKGMPCVFDARWKP
jgi:hypothetical protein